MDMKEVALRGEANAIAQRAVEATRERTTVLLKQSIATENMVLLFAKLVAILESKA
jgi:hypothetical protein